MKKINESWGPGTNDLSDENPFNGALSNLDDVRRSMPSEASSDAHKYFEQLWDELIRNAEDWDALHSDGDETVQQETLKTVTVASFLSMLKADIVKFRFEKKDGTVRTALGTRNSTIIGSYLGSSTSASTSVKRTPKPGMISYFDLDKKAFRSFNETKLIGVLNEHAKVPVTSSSPAVSESRILKLSEVLEITNQLDFGDHTEE